MMLSIGVIAGGSETGGTTVGRLLRSLATSVIRARGPYPCAVSGSLNVVFHVPGSVLGDLDYEGVRDGPFSCRRRLLMVQVAVPKEIVACQDGRIVRTFLIDSLREANKIAAKYFKKKGIEYSQPKFLGLVDAVEARFSSRE